MCELHDLSRDELIAVILELQEQVTTFQAQVAGLESQVGALECQVAAQKEELESLRGNSGDDDGPSQGPHWVKSNRPKRGGKKRKKREGAFAREREEPTEIREHAVDQCPDCGRGLEGGWVHRSHQVIELPEVRYRVIEHRVIGRRCGVCGKRWIPKLDLSKEVVGRHRIGIRLMSLVAYLRTVARMPGKTVQSTLEAQYGLHLSEGEITELCHTVADIGSKEYDQLLKRIRASPVVHADETGWREDGISGYLWVLSTPDGRYLLYDGSRSARVVHGLVGEDFAGVLVSDFYSGYHPLMCLKQRCWVHLLRDLKQLAEEYSGRLQVKSWVARVREVYDQAKAFQGSQRELDVDEEAERKNLNSRVMKARAKARRKFESALRRLAKPYAEKADDPRRVLAKRMMSFLSELFVFVERPEVPSGNNAAERALRPAVIGRKISGGTRSPKGSRTKSILMSLFGTWQLQGRPPLDACIAMLQT